MEKEGEHRRVQITATATAAGTYKVAEGSTDTLPSLYSMLPPCDRLTIER